MMSRMLLRRGDEEIPLSLWNKITTTGLNLTARLLADEPFGLTHIALGEGSTPPAATDTALETERYRDEITRRVVGANYCELELFIPRDQGNGVTYREAGVLAIGRRSSAVGEPAQLFNRVLLVPEIPKTDTIEVSIVCQINVTEKP